MESGRARVVLVGTGPLDSAQRLQARVAHPAVHRREAAQLVPNRLNRLVGPVATEAPGQFGDDLDVIASAGRRLERLPHPLHPAFAVGDRALRLRPGGTCGQHHVGQLSGSGQVEVLDHQVL